MFIYSELWLIYFIIIDYFMLDVVKVGNSIGDYFLFWISIGKVWDWD